MKLLLASICAAALAQAGWPQNLTVPKTVTAGSAFIIDSSGAGKATLYIAGLGQVRARDVVLGAPIEVPAGTISNAGHYIAFLAGSSDVSSFEVTPGEPAKMTFLARPSRLPVGIRRGITGAVYLFDAYGNLVTAPTAVRFELETPGGSEQALSATTHDGAAWVAMDSSPKEGAAHLVARAGGISSTRVIGQVPGDPCSLRMSAKPDGQKIALTTDPVRDCSGNAVPDGTIVTFTENFDGGQSTVDVPIKRGVAEVEMPAHPRASLSVASGVVLGNQIQWGR